MKTLIIGAGPVGMILALLLNRQGKGVVIIDKRTTLSELPRGIAINQQTLSIFEKIGVLPDVINIGISIPRLNIYKGGKKIGDLTFEDPSLQHPYFFHVRQSDVEQVLAKKLDDLGIKVKLGHTLVGINQGIDHAIAEIETPAGKNIRYTTDIIAGCDGGNSACCRLAGIKIDRVSYGGSFQLADLVLSGAPYPRSETHYILSSDGYLMLVPAPRGETRVIASFCGHLDVKAKNLDIQAFEQLIKTRIGGNPRIERLFWSTQSAFGHRVADRAKAGRVILAGDALHQFSPIGGTNMNVGISDAEALAEAIDSNNLDAYDHGRSSVVTRQIALTKYLTYLMVRPDGMRRPPLPFKNRTLNGLLTNELPPLLTGFPIPEIRHPPAFAKAQNDFIAT